MPNQKAPASENAEPAAEGNGFEYDCEPRRGVFTVEEMNAMMPPEIQARFAARQKELAARYPQNQGGDDGAQ